MGGGKGGISRPAAPHGEMTRWTPDPFTPPEPLLDSDTTRTHGGTWVVSFAKPNRMVG